MGANKYKIWAVGQPVGDGVSGSIHVGMAAVAKKANAGEPSIVINELFCNLIARSLFLPCPPGALLDNGGENYFCSLNFNLAGQSLPPAPIGVLVSKYPEICWGILLFDALVMNPDRHHKNLSFDRTTGAVQIFDHSRAFLPNKETIESVIQANTSKLGFTGHCLKNELASLQGFDFWSVRIRSLPNYAIEAAIEELTTVGFPSDKKSLTINFFKSRRDNIETIIKTNLSEFPKLPKPVVTVVAPPPPASGVNPVAPPPPASQPAPKQ